jgi:hypothetical protein
MLPEDIKVKSFIFINRPVFIARSRFPKRYHGWSPSTFSAPGSSSFEKNKLISTTSLQVDHIFAFSPFATFKTLLIPAWNIRRKIVESDPI